MRYIIGILILYCFSIWCAEEAILHFKEKRGWQENRPNRTIIVNEKDPMRIIAIEGEVLIYIKNNYIEVVLKETSKHGEGSTTDEDN